jgi:hypothetical protein
VFSTFSRPRFGIKSVYNYGHSFVFLENTFQEVCYASGNYRKGYLEGSVNNFDLVEIHLDVKNPRIQSDWKYICREKKQMKTKGTLEMTTAPLTKKALTKDCDCKIICIGKNEIQRFSLPG